MLSKKVKTRLVFLGISFLLAAVLTFFTLKTLKTNIVYFLSPTDVYNQNDLNFNKKVRIGGLVKEGSILYLKMKFLYLMRVRYLTYFLKVRVLLLKVNFKIKNIF